MYQFISAGIRTYHQTTLTCAALLILAGCSAEPVAPPANTLPKPYPTTAPAQPIPAPDTPSITANTGNKVSLRAANQLLQQGRKLEAAQAYYQAALNYSSPQKERIILQAAEITASSGDANLTNQYLARVQPQNLSGDSAERMRYVKALLALQVGRADHALNLLPSDEAVKSSPALAEKVHHVRSRALGAKGVPTPTAIRKAAPTPQAQTNDPVIPERTDRIAVLLPKAGSLGAAAAEIYKGIQMAQAQTGTGTQLKFYSVDQGAAAQYQAAIAEGADMIIGPLDKETIVELARNPAQLTKPILALNYLDSNARTPGTLYQFGLSPEDEAAQVATTALQRGHTQAVVMVPDSSWGERLGKAFAKAYQAGGGQVLTTDRYPNSPKGYLEHVQRTVGNTQAQMVFLAASPTQARLMRPLLQAQAGLLPVYATSHIFSGRLEPSKDADLDGIIYTEIPWVLENVRTGGLASSPYPRMFALGIDAFLVANNLQSLVYGNQALKGKTGQVSMQHQKIERTLGLATFINGEPAPLE